MNTEQTEKPVTPEAAPAETSAGLADRARETLTSAWGTVRKGASAAADRVGAAGRRATQSLQRDKLPVAVAGDAPYKPKNTFARRVLARVPTNGILLLSALVIWGAIYLIFIL